MFPVILKKNTNYHYSNSLKPMMSAPAMCVPFYILNGMTPCIMQWESPEIILRFLMSYSKIVW